MGKSEPWSSILYQMVTMSLRCVIVVLGPLTLALSSASAQPAFGHESAPVGVLNAVISYRLGHMGDSSKIATCESYEALGKPKDFSTSIPPTYRAYFDRALLNCNDGATEGGMKTRARLTVDSIMIGDASADLFATVVRGEYRHREHYSLHSQRLGDRVLWVIRQVVLDQNVRTHPGH
jgi:hypothetical protein